MLEQHYLYKNSKTLKNKHGIKNPQKLYEHYTQNAAKAAENFRHEPPPKIFNTAYLKLIHWSLFYKNFEWAGHTRDVPFTFQDGSTAHMPAMRPTGYEIPFAIGPQIKKELKKLEKILSEKNNLQGLSRQEFAKEAAEIFIALNHIHPFRKGNGHTQRMFMEKLGQAAGHKIDFSFTTKKRMTVACIEAMQHGNPQPMRDLFEDITHPQKSLILKEFMSQMQRDGLEEINNYVVNAVKEGVSYDGIYRGSSANIFVLEMEDDFIIGHKDDLPPECIKSINDGDVLSFHKPNVHPLKEVLVPSEKLPPLTHAELCEKIANNSFVEANRKKIEQLSKIIYNNSQILSIKLNMINANPELGGIFSNQIAQNPQSIGKLAGTKMLCIKSSQRIRAEEAIPQLSVILKNYVITTQQAKEEILEQHAKEQKRLEKLVVKPEKELQNLFALPPEQQQNTLFQSASLQQQLHVFSRQLQNRLSSEDYKAIKEKDVRKLSRLLGVSENKAKEISKTVQLVKTLQTQVRSLRMNRTLSTSLSD